MDTATIASILAAGAVVLTVVAAGPLFGAGSPDQGTELGDGNATVERVELTEPLVITDGRFGTDVAYLRVPDAVVHLSSVTGGARLVYTVEVPALEFERVGARRLSADGGTRISVGMADRAFRHESLDRESYRGAVSVRVQSFTTDRTVFERTVTVEVRTNG